MLKIQKNLSSSFLALLSLPATAVGFALSTQIAALSWLLSTRFGLDIHEVAFVWLAGPMAGIIGQPIVGAISDDAWFLGGRRKPFILIGGVLGSLMFLALPNIGIISSALGFEGILIIASIIALMLDLSINITFNPARSIIADLTPEGKKRTSGYTWMQLISGIFGLLAYFISLVLGNDLLIHIAVVLVLVFSVIPCLFIEEDKNMIIMKDGEIKQEKTSFFQVLKIIYPLSGFLFFGFYVIISKFIIPSIEKYQSEVMFFCIGITIALGILVVLKGIKKESDENEFHKIMVAHSFSWLGIQSMFVMSFFFAKDVIVPKILDNDSTSNSFSNFMKNEDKITKNSILTYDVTKEIKEQNIKNELDKKKIITNQIEFNQIFNNLIEKDLKGISQNSFISICKEIKKGSLADIVININSIKKDKEKIKKELLNKSTEELVQNIILNSHKNKDYINYSSKINIYSNLVKNEIIGSSAGNILSLAFLLFNFIGAFFPVLILEPISKKIGRVKTYSASIFIMSVAYFLIWKFGGTEINFYAGICLAGIGWSAVISIVFAIMTERVNKSKMGLYMGLFNYSVVLPQMMTLGVASMVKESKDNSILYLICGISLFLSFVFWIFIREPKNK